MSLIAEKPPTEAQVTRDLPVAPDSRTALWAYSAAVVPGLLLLDVFGGLSYAIARIDEGRTRGIVIDGSTSALCIIEGNTTNRRPINKDYPSPGPNPKPLKLK